MGVKFYKDLFAEHGLTARQVNEDFSLLQLNAIFAAGYTYKEFEEWADANQDILTKAAEKFAEMRKQPARTINRGIRNTTTNRSHRNTYRPTQGRR